LRSTGKFQITKRDKKKEKTGAAKKSNLRRMDVR